MSAAPGKARHVDARSTSSSAATCPFATRSAIKMHWRRKRFSQAMMSSLTTMSVSNPHPAGADAREVVGRPGEPQ